MDKKEIVLMILMSIMTGSLMARDFSNDRDYIFEGQSINNQEVTQDQQTFRFIYVSKDNDMIPGDLIERLKKYASIIDGDESPAIFYAPNEESPYIETFYFNDDKSVDLTSINRYIEKQKNFVVPEDECDKILSIIADYDFLDLSGEVKYKQMIFDFIVGEGFWEKGNHEKVIASLFFQLNATKYMEEKKMQFNVHFIGSEKYYNKKIGQLKPFGLMNVDDINNKVKPIREE